MISSVTTDYTGRTKDINIFGYKNPEKQQRSTATLTFGGVSSYCAGVQKLIQRYTIALLTKIGSQVNYPGFGTGFVGAMDASQSQQDLQHVLTFANALVIDQFRQYQAVTDGLPLDEQIQTVVINNITYDSGFLYLDLSILTLAGESVQYILPLPQVEN